MVSRRIFVKSSIGGLCASTASFAQAATCESWQEDAALLSALKISRFSPRARSDLVSAIVNTWGVAVAGGMITPIRIQHFMTQLATETGGFSRIDESLHYSAKRLRTIFPKYVKTNRAAARLEYNDQQIANLVYGGRMDNDKPNDGYKYRGSGFIQLTGKANFRKRGQELGLDLVGQPELARTPVPGFRIAVAFWKAIDANPIADRDDLVALRKRVNGGKNGLKEAGVWLARARRHFSAGVVAPDEADEPDPLEIQEVQNRLKELRLLKVEPGEAAEPDEYVEALKEFRENRKLPYIDTSTVPKALQARVLYDEDVLYALTDPLEMERVDETP